MQKSPGEWSRPGAKETMSHGKWSSWNMTEAARGGGTELGTQSVLLWGSTDPTVRSRKPLRPRQNLREQTTVSPVMLGGRFRRSWSWGLRAESLPWALLPSSQAWLPEVWVGPRGCVLRF